MYKVQMLKMFFLKFCTVLRYYLKFFTVCYILYIIIPKQLSRTSDGLGVPAVRRRQVCVKLLGLALAHILLFIYVTLVRLGVWVRVQVWGRG